MIGKSEISALKDYLETNEESELNIARSFLEDVILELGELKQYRSIGTVEECREAAERYTAKKYKMLKPCKSVTYYQCPVCDTLLHINENFCGNCGQRISWEESEGEDD